MKNTKEITLNVDKSNPVTVFAKQGDHKTRFLKIKLLNNGIAYKLSSGEKVVFRFLKPDGNSGLNSVTFDSDGDIIVELTDQVLAVSGTVYADIAVMNGDTVISSATFSILSSAYPVSNDQIESSTEFSYIREIGTIAKESVDKSQSFAKRAEDAALKVEKVSAAIDKQPGYFCPEVGINKWNASLNVNEMLVNQNTGTIYYCDYMCTSDYIDVSDYKGKNISIYTCNKSGSYLEAYFRLAFYDENKKYVSGINNNPSQVKATHIVPVPNNAAYLRVSASNNLNKVGYYMLVEGENIIRGVKYELLEYKISDTRIKAEKNEKDITALKSNSVSLVLKNGINRLDINKVKNGYQVNTHNGDIINTGVSYDGISDYIPVKEGEKLFFAKNNTNDDAFVFFPNFGFAFYDKDKIFLKGGKMPDNSVKFPVAEAPKNAAFVIFYTGAINGSSRHYIVSDIESCPTVGSIHSLYEPYSEPKKVVSPNILDNKDMISVSSGWKNKTALFYGDSITAMGNNEGPCWQDIVASSLGLARYYVRGVGGQTYVRNNKPWFANADGSYYGRNDSGDMTNPSSFTVPNGKTAHYGYFASWDRIKTMISDDIKDKIDLIFVFGINDGTLNETMDIPEFVSGTSSDSSWMSASENVFGGDFDVKTLNGGVASTLMKLQTRCPNAIIVTGTSWSGIGETGVPHNSPKYNIDGIKIKNEGNIVKKISEFYSIPCIDIWANTGVNPWNREKYLSDMLHPYKNEGKKMLARAVVSGLRTISPRY